jgi:hypothetical protein
VSVQSGERPAHVPARLTGERDQSDGVDERSRSVRDRRVVLTSLTERGRTLVERRRADFEPRFRAAFAGFSDRELMIAAAALDRLRALFDELAEERGAPASRR